MSFEPEVDIITGLLNIYKDEKIIDCIKICTFAFLPENIALQETIYIIHRSTGPSLFLPSHQIHTGRRIPFP